MASDTTVLGNVLTAAPTVGVGATMAYSGAGVAILLMAVVGIALVIVGFVLTRTAMLRSFDPAVVEPGTRSHPPPGS